jgi:hypothetical protein
VEDPVSHKKGTRQFFPRDRADLRVLKTLQLIQEHKTAILYAGD